MFQGFYGIDQDPPTPSGKKGLLCGHDFMWYVVWEKNILYVLNLVLPNPIQKQTKYLPYNV